MLLQVWEQMEVWRCQIWRTWWVLPQWIVAMAIADMRVWRGVAGGGGGLSPLKSTPLVNFPWHSAMIVSQLPQQGRVVLSNYSMPLSKKNQSIKLHWQWHPKQLTPKLCLLPGRPCLGESECFQYFTIKCCLCVKGLWFIHSHKSVKKSGRISFKSEQTVTTDAESDLLLSVSQTLGVPPCRHFSHTKLHCLVKM